MVSGFLYLIIELYMNKVIVNRIIVRELESCKEVIIFKFLFNLFELDFNEKVLCNFLEDFGYF